MRDSAASAARKTAAAKRTIASCRSSTIYVTASGRRRDALDPLLRPAHEVARQRRLGRHQRQVIQSEIATVLQHLPSTAATGHELLLKFWQYQRIGQALRDQQRLRDGAVRRVFSQPGTKAAFWGEDAKIVREAISASPTENSAPGPARQRPAMSRASGRSATPT